MTFEEFKEDMRYLKAKMLDFRLDINDGYAMSIWYEDLKRIPDSEFMALINEYVNANDYAPRSTKQLISFYYENVKQTYADEVVKDFKLLMKWVRGGLWPNNPWYNIFNSKKYRKAFNEAVHSNPLMNAGYKAIEAKIEGAGSSVLCDVENESDYSNWKATAIPWFAKAYEEAADKKAREDINRLLTTSADRSKGLIGDEDKASIEDIAKELGV